MCQYLFFLNNFILLTFFKDLLTLIEDVNLTKLHTLTLIPEHFRALYNSYIFTLV